MTNFKTTARNITSETAAIKDWRVATKRNRALRELAREIKNIGYIVASPEELRKKYNGLYDFEPTAPNNDKRIVWAIGENTAWGRNGRATLMFVPVCNPEEL
ncbi:MAG: hypothetical protein K2H46_02510 [Muribaculaceae bacterium]|nr:hypothetical protein [Muribaculaceae bacterium]